MKYFGVKQPSKIECKNKSFTQLKSEKMKSKNECVTGENFCKVLTCI